MTELWPAAAGMINAVSNEKASCITNMLTGPTRRDPPPAYAALAPSVAAAAAAAAASSAPVWGLLGVGKRSTYGIYVRERERDNCWLLDAGHYMSLSSHLGDFFAKGLCPEQRAAVLRSLAMVATPSPPTDTPSPSISKHLLMAEGGAAEIQNGLAAGAGRDLHWLLCARHGSPDISALSGPRSQSPRGTAPREPACRPAAV